MATIATGEEQLLPGTLPGLAGARRSGHIWSRALAPSIQSLRRAPHPRGALFDKLDAERDRAVSNVPVKKNCLGLFVAALYAIGAGCSDAGSGGIDLIQIDRPAWYVWYQCALVAAFLYLPVAPLLAVHAADIRVIAALPLIGGTALSSFVLLKGLEVLHEISPHFGRGVVAALLAESIFLWSVGAAVSAATSLAIGVIARKKGTVPRSTPSGSIALVLSAAATVCTAALMLHVWTTVGGVTSPAASAAPILFVISLVALSAAAVSAFCLQRKMQRPASARWLWLFAVLSAVGAALVLLVGEKLTAVAAAGT